MQQLAYTSTVIMPPALMRLVLRRFTGKIIVIGPANAGAHNPPEDSIV